MEYLVLGNGGVGPYCPEEPGRCGGDFCYECPNFCNADCETSFCGPVCTAYCYPHCICVTPPGF